MIMAELWYRSGQELGKKGEDTALEYLLQRGMKLMERNWRSGHKELDLVMEDGDTIRFVEVKAREYPAMAEPFENVGASKRAKVISAAKGFLAVKGKEGILQGGKEVGFDVVSILFNGELFEIKYIRDAFEPSW